MTEHISTAGSAADRHPKSASMTPDPNDPPFGRPVVIHNLKTWPQYFARILDGSKTFEVRINDRDFCRGDRLLLREYDPDTDTYSGRAIRADVGYVLADSCAAIPDFAGHVVFSLHNVVEVEHRPGVRERLLNSLRQSLPPDVTDEQFKELVATVDDYAERLREVRRRERAQMLADIDAADEDD